VIRLFGILLLNIWHNRPQIAGLSAAVVLISMVTLVVSSNVLADTPTQGAHSGTTQYATALHTQINQSSPTVRTLRLRTVSSALVHSLTTPSTVGTNNTVAANQQSPEQIATSQSASNSNNGSANASQTTQTNAPPASQGSVQLTSVQVTCEQGQSTYTVASAQLTLSTPTTTSSSVTWSWETQVNSGTNTSGTPPISTTQSSQTIPAGTSSFTLAPADPSQPLLSTSDNSNYTYSFRLDISGPIDVNSSWVSVPQSTASSC
jgi:hypothetical protein